MIKIAFLKNVANSNNTGPKYFINSPTENANDSSHLCFRNTVFCEDKSQIMRHSNRPSMVLLARVGIKNLGRIR